MLPLQRATTTTTTILALITTLVIHRLRVQRRLADATVEPTATILTQVHGALHTLSLVIVFASALCNDQPVASIVTLDSQLHQSHSHLQRDRINLAQMLMLSQTSAYMRY